MDAISNNSKRSMMPAGHHSDSDSTLLPLPKSSITWFGGIFARLPPLAAGLYEDFLQATFVSRFDYVRRFEKIKFSSCDLYFFIYVCGTSRWACGMVLCSEKFNFGSQTPFNGTT